MRQLSVLPIAVFFDTGSIDCHDLTFNIGQHAIGVTAATTRSFTIGKIIKLRVLEAQLEAMNINECKDFLELSDPGDGTVFARLCQEGSKTFFLQSNRLRLSLIQDAGVTARGFSLQWSFLNEDEWEYIELIKDIINIYLEGIGLKLKNEKKAH